MSQKKAFITGKPGPSLHHMNHHCGGETKPERSETRGYPRDRKRTGSDQHIERERNNVIAAGRGGGGEEEEGVKAAAGVGQEGRTCSKAVEAAQQRKSSEAPR